jgi:AAA15 family ATPase/GTPase
LSVTGDVTDLKVDQLGDNLAVLFRHTPEGVATKSHSLFDAGRESDGTLRVAGILTALLQEPHLTLVAIEEPELTIHPGQLALVLDFLRMASEWSQVVVTTHSPEILDRVEADEIRVVQRSAGTSTISPMSREQKHLVMNQLLSPGQLMRSEGLAAEPEVS